jgi:ribosome maturation factor RimP
MAMDLDTIRSAADRVAGSHGLEVVEVEALGGGKHRTLRIFIEKNAEGRKLAAEEAKKLADDAAASGLVRAAEMDQLAGVTHTDCEAFSRDFGTLMDVEELAGNSEYTLEVSSPGLDRKLYGPADYVRFAGNLAKVQTRQPVDGNRHWLGHLREVTRDGFALELQMGKPVAKGRKVSAKRPAQSVRIAFDNVEKAQLVPEI